MSGLIDRGDGGPVVVEMLEARRLLSFALSLNNGVLEVQETNSGVSNFTTIQLVNDSMQLEINESGDSVVESNALSNLGWTVDGQLRSASGPETGISRILVDTDDGQDTLVIPGMNLPVLIQPRGGVSELISLGQQNSPDGAQDITEPITFDGTHAQSASISVDDRLNGGDVDPTITSTSLLNFAGAPINFTAPPQGNLTFDPLTISCFAGTGRSAFIIDQDGSNSAAIAYQIDCNGQGIVGVEHLNANSQVNIIGDNGGSEKALVGSLGLISGVLGKLEVNGNSGSASLVINDSNDTIAHTFATQSSGQNLFVNEDGVRIAELDAPSTAFTLETGTATNAVNLDLQAFGAGFTASVESGGTNDAIAVSSLGSGAELDLVGGAGVDNVSIKGNAVVGTVNISNATGLEAVSIDGSTSTPQVISVSDRQVTGMGSGLFLLANLKSLSVTGGSGFDNFSVVPSATVPMTIDGGPTSGVSTDRLDVNTANVSGTLLMLEGGTSETGTYTFGNRQPVSFIGFATISPSVGDLSGTVYNAQSNAVVTGASVVVDENNNGVADAGEPTILTDASGIFTLQGLPTGTFGLLVEAVGLQNLSTVSATISAGVFSMPVVVGVIPIATAGGPDLVATVVASAPGKGGSIKPRVVMKVSNLGASMTSAAGLQIVVVASPDKVLDLTDQELLTGNMPAVLLKTKRSKTFNLSGSTAASLIKGSYFVLASVDAGNAVAESNEANDVGASAKAVVLAPPVVDLTAKFGGLPKKISASKLLTVALAIQNLGTISAAGTIDFDFFASSDKTLDGSDVSLGTGFPVAAHLAAAKSQTARFKLSISPSLAAGSYYLVARVNSSSSISESDLSNNVVFSNTLTEIVPVSMSVPADF